MVLLFCLLRPSTEAKNLPQIISLITVHHVCGMMFVFLNSAFVLSKIKQVYTLQNVRHLFAFSLVSCSFVLYRSHGCQFYPVSLCLSHDH